MLEPLLALFLGSLFVLALILLFWPKGGLVGYLGRVQRLSARVQREDALKHIYKAEIKGRSPDLSTVAGTLGINSNRAAALLEEMEDLGLITLETGCLCLTPAGREYAVQVLRAHRLFERHLAEETGYAETDWHELADRFEHRLSPEETEALSSQLGNPTHDPHGDPIPTPNGELVPHGGQPLNGLAVNQTALIVHIEDEPRVVYDQIAAEGLYPGMEVRLISAEPQRVRFWANEELHTLAPIVASNISVVAIESQPGESLEANEPLSILQSGESGEIVTISPRLRGPERRRLMDLGILPGTRIQAEMTSPSGDPTAYRVRDTLIALRREQAQFIRIKQVEELAV